MDFAILGPTRVRVDDEEVRLGAVKRVLLTLLIVHANRSLSIGEILDDLRTAEHPAAGATTVKSRIRALRTAVGPDRLQTVSSGYRLFVAPGELDAALFEAEVDRARGALARGATAGAADVLAIALARWRGPVLVDAQGAAWAAAEMARLEELRLSAEELLLQARLEIGPAAEVVLDAEAGVRAQPYREERTATLMLALQRSGRRADAMAAYERFRLLRAAQLGGEPSTELAQLQRDLELSTTDHSPSGAEGRSRAPVGSEPGIGPLGGRTLPGGVVTFLMTDIVGSTRLWERDSRTMRHALVRHDELMAKAVETHRGVLLRERGEGDSTFSVFARATDGAAAAVSAQRAFAEEPWPTDCVIRVRMALHTGEASERDGDYYGRPVNRVARLRGIASGGQILISKSTAEIVVDHLPGNLALVEQGLELLKDMDRPEMVYILTTLPVPAGLFEGDTSGGHLESRPDFGAAVAAVPDAAEAEIDEPEQIRPTTWEVVVSADLAHFARSEREELAFPLSRSEQSFPLALPRLLIGRRSRSLGIVPEIDLSGDLEDPGVSRVHAILERRPDGCYDLIDPGSTNGTFFNDGPDPVAPGTHVRLRSGDRVYVGAWTRVVIVAR